MGGAVARGGDVVEGLRDMGSFPPLKERKASCSSPLIKERLLGPALQTQTKSPYDGATARLSAGVKNRLRCRAGLKQLPRLPAALLEPKARGPGFHTGRARF